MAEIFEEDVPSIGSIVAPTAADDTATTSEDSSVEIPVLANDSDEDGDDIRVASLGEPANGTASVSGGVVTYTPNADFNGSDTFTYTISDDTDGESTASVSVTVTPVNDTPVGNEDEAITDEDTPVTIDALANDTDIDGDALSIAGTSAASNGTVEVVDNQIVYTPAPDFNGTDSFGYRVTDPTGAFFDSSVSVVVNAVNDVPVVTSESATTTEDETATFEVLANDSDPDGDAISITGISTPANGTAEIVDGGGAISYTPNENFNGADQITYTVSDPNGGSTEGVLDITIDPANDAPIAEPDVATTDEDVATEIAVLANDSDIDEGDSLVIENVSDPANGTILDITPDRTIIYRPDADFNGTDTFEYTVADSNGGSTTSTVEVTVNPVNDAPSVVNDTATVTEDTPAILDVAANDEDIDEGDQAALGASAILEAPTNGTATVNEDGTVTYTPNENYNGPDGFVYEVSDPSGATGFGRVDLTIAAVNDAPVAADDVATTTEDSGVRIPVRANDTDVDGDIVSVIGIAGAPANGSVTVNENGTIDYMPNADFNGTDTFTYEVADGNEGTDTAVVTVTVEPANDAPVVAADEAVTDEDTPITIDVLANDSDIDEGDTLSISNNGQGENGSVAVSDGQIVYTPNENFNGTDTFQYEASDGNGGTTVGTVSVTVNAVNDAPVANPVEVTLDEDTPTELTVLFNDVDVDGDSLAISAISVAPTNGTAEIISGEDGSAILYTPNADFNGTDSLTYTVADGNGGTAEATASLTINPVNDTPVPVADEATTDEDTPVTINALANDTDIDGDALTITNNGQGENGTVSIVDNQLVYTPDPNFNGTDTFQYMVDDGNGGTALSSVTVTVNSVNDLPVVEDETARIVEDEVTRLPVLANDSDPDGDTLTISAISAGPSNGTATIVSTEERGTVIEYVTNPDYNGPDSLTYVVSDGNGGEVEGTLTLEIANSNDAPVANPDMAETDEDTATEIFALENDVDIDGDVFLISGISDPANGEILQVTPDRTIIYRPDTNFNGVDSFTYTIDDGNGGTSTTTVEVTVNSVNDDPVAVNEDFPEALEDQPLIIDAAANDTDVDAGDQEALFVSAILEAPTNGTTEINPDGTFTYTPNENFVGTDRLIYEVSDPNGGTGFGTVRMRINNVNDAPEAEDDVATTTEDRGVRIFVRENDSDIDGDIVSVAEEITVAPQNGTAVKQPNGAIDYMPDPEFSGTDTFVYTAFDGNGGEDTATVTVTVESVNDVPVLPEFIDNPEELEDQAVTVDVVGNAEDPDATSLTITSIGPTTNGTVTNNGDGTITITPDADYNGGFRVPVTISDDQGATATTTVRALFNPVNDDPIAEDDTATVEPGAIGVRIFVRDNDTDPDGDIVSVEDTIAFGPSNGTATKNPNGTIDYMPDEGFSGTDSFVYTATDGNGGSDTATVTITVLPDPSPASGLGEDADLV